MTFATLRALHAVIGSAINDIERVYRPTPDVVLPVASSSPPKPQRPPRSPHRQTHLPSPPSYSPSPPPRSRSRSPDFDLDSDCSHTIDISSLPSPISVKFAVPTNLTARQRSRAHTLPNSVRPPLPKRSDSNATEVQETLDWPDMNEPFVRPSRSDEATGDDDTPRKSKAEREEELTTRPAVINAINRIVAACAQLEAAVQRPFLTLCDAALGYHLPSCLRFLETSHTVEILRDAGPQGLHVKEIAKLIAERFAPGVVHKPVDVGMLSHVLRLLATHHITREVRPDVFANNRLSSFMDSGKDVQDLIIGVGAESKYEGTNGIAAFVGLGVDELFKASAYLTDCFLLPELTNVQMPLSPTLTTLPHASSPIDDRRPQETTRAHFHRSSDASSEVDTGGNYALPYPPPSPSTHSRAGSVTSSGSNNPLLPPVSIPTHKPSYASLNNTKPKHKSSLSSLASPTHKSSLSSLSSATNVSSPLSSVQLSPVREKATPTRKKSQSFLRRIGSKAMLSPAFGGNAKEDPIHGEGSINWEVPPSPSLRSPRSLLSLRRGHAHTASSVSTNTNASVSVAAAASPESPESQSPSPPPVPPKPMLITATHPMHAPFNLAFRTTQPYFEWLERSENVFRLKRFGKAMTGTSGWEVPGAILEGLAWEELPPGSVVVDVGGGIGSTSMLLANAFKHLRFVVQDRDPVVEMGVAAWKQRCPELLTSGQAAFQAHDFLTPQPALPPSLDLSQSQDPQGPPAVYLLRVITHDWPDGFVTRILLHLRNAAGPDTKLLIADHLLPLACIDEDDASEALPGTVRTLAPEGSPLLPNLGKANANAYWMDLTMRVTFNSQERTLRELAAVALTAGWKVVHVSRAEGSLFGHVVAVPVDIPPASLALLKKTEPTEGRSRSGTITSPHPGLGGGLGTMYNPPMGDTFFSQVHLPSEEQTRLFRFRFARLLGKKAHAHQAPGPTAAPLTSGRKRSNTVGHGRTPERVPDAMPMTMPAVDVPLTASANVDTEGIVLGIGTALVFYPAISATAHFYAKKRGTMLGVTTAGSSVGAVVFPVAINKLIPTVGFPWAVRIIGFICLAMLIPVILMVKSRLPRCELARFGNVIDFSGFQETRYSLFVIGAMLTGFGPPIAGALVDHDSGKFGHMIILSGVMYVLFWAARFAGNPRVFVRY
ncbi:hypothetical protein EUX98_g4870 [Antrodiella citrinella]|uniref:O-methyltransferase C-terminal domain-containing protein n=1 Tax=Antrodiella citrinella TaxID=2447956 RepID=A0A4S4MVD2_9APHY|nr:hypothetical protein EUX98_g4870 [Antrodiella citrinella]